MTTATLKERLRRVIRPILLLCLALILQNPSMGTIFPQIPPTTAKWEIASPDNNHIGEVIKATLRVTFPPGVMVNMSKLPNVGDVLLLPARVDDTSGPYQDYPLEIPEGELEVVSRRDREYYGNGHLVTEIDYELMYLLPLDLSSPPGDDKLLPWDVDISQRYRRLFVRTGKVDWFTNPIPVEMAGFRIVPRVDESSQPIFGFFTLVPTSSYWPARLAGIGLIALAFGLAAWRVVRFIKARRRPAPVVEKPPEIGQLYERWCENPDKEIFITALKLYRRGIWGRPQTSMWVTSTFILYSGVFLSSDQMNTVFAHLVKEVSDEPNL